MHRQLFAAAIGATLLVGGATRAPAALSGRIYRNAACRVLQLELPRGWELTPSAQNGYPRVLVLGGCTKASRCAAVGARLSLGAQRVVPGTGALDLAAAASALLARQGWLDPRIVPDGDRVKLDADLDERRRFLHQVYLVDGDLAFVLTVVAPADRRERALRDFEDALRSLQLAPPGTSIDGTASDASGHCG